MRYRVALLIETSNAYARGLLQGIYSHIREQDSWSTYFPELSRGDAPPESLKRWRGDGVIARVENRHIAEIVSRLKVPGGRRQRHWLAAQCAVGRDAR